MESQGTRYGYAVRIEPGEEIIATLAEFAARVGVRAGEISGIGAGKDFELGFFVPSTRQYIRRTFHEDCEITCLMGNFSELEGKPYPHCHIVIGGEDFVPWTGH